MENDWRLMGQDEYLRGATLVRKPYRLWSETWEHDHCEFCGTKLMDPSFSEAHAQFVRDHSDVMTEGYAAQGTGPQGEDDYHWICDGCFADFRQSFEWRVVSAPEDAD
jgi:hypothetical protein